MTDFDEVMRFLSIELRDAREEAGLSRITACRVIADRTGLVIGDRTLLAWEHNLRELQVKKFVQASVAYEASPARMITTALLRANHSGCPECGR